MSKDTRISQQLSDEAFFASRRDADLSAGVLARPGIYVVRHCDPIHALPHEILISTATILPECNACRSVRFSLKSSLQKLEQCEFFGLESLLLAVRALYKAREIDRWVARSRSFLEESEQFLAGFDKTAQPNGRELSPIAPRAKTPPRGSATRAY